MLGEAAEKDPAQPRRRGAETGEQTSFDVEELVERLAKLTHRVAQLEAAEVEAVSSRVQEPNAPPDGDAPSDFEEASGDGDDGDELPEGFREFLFDYLEESADCRREGRGDSSPEFPPHDLARRPSLSASSDGIWSDGRSSEGRPEGSSVLGAAGKAVIRSVAQKAGAILSPRSGASSASVCSEVELDVHFCDDQPVQLGQSIWDAALLTGCRHISRADSMLIVLLVLLNIAAQSIFLGIVYYIFMEEKFTERFHAHMLEWRTHVGHHIQHYDPYTFSSLTERICQPDKHTPELSSYISKQVETMHTFLDKGNVFFNGQNLLSVAILCWTLTIVREVCQAWNISRAARCLPRDGGTRIVQPRKNRSHVCRLAGISKERKRWWDMVVSLRIACALVLWIMGCRFLCFYSITPEAVLLDVVALEVVLSVDEAVFTLAPRAVCEIVERLEPLKAAPRLCRRGSTDLRPFCLTAVVVCTLFGCSSFVIAPLVEQIALVNATVCGGVQDFVFTIDPLKVVHYAPTNPNRVDVTEAESFPSFNAIQELWERLGDAESLREGPPLRALAHSLDELRRSDDISMSEASGALQTLSGATCDDILGTSPSLLRYAREVARWALEHPDFGWVGVPSASGCADLAPTCPFIAMTRALCPVTCGCSDPLGLVLAATSEHGCPAACAESAEFWSKSSELTCGEKAAAELRESSAVWRAWAEQLDSLLLGRYAGGAPLPPVCGASCEEVMLREGCRIIEVWRERMQADPCEGAWTSTEPVKISRPLSKLCPVTCGCSVARTSQREFAGRACPSQCRALNSTA